MGANVGKEKGTSETDKATKGEKDKPMSIEERVNMIAAKYITKGVSDFYRFKDPKYCSDLVILTSEALQTQLNSFELEKVNAGQEGKGNTSPVYVTTHDKAQKIGLRGTAEKERMCRDIARFYVQIAHVFAAIQAAVSPEERRDSYYSDYSEYSDSRYYGQYPRDVPDIKGDLSRSACARRLAALKPVERDGVMTIDPRKVCRINRRRRDRDSTDYESMDLYGQGYRSERDYRSYGSSGYGRTRDKTSESVTSDLARELAPGFKKLEALYEDKWNGKAFEGKTKEMLKKYEADVAKFYSAFTDGDPPKDDDGNVTIKHFSGIPLKPFNDEAECMTIDEARELKCGSMSGDKARCVGTKGCNWNTQPGSPGACVMGDAALYRLGEIKLQKPKSRGDDETSSNVFVVYGRHYREMLDRSKKIKMSLNKVLDQLFTTYSDSSLTRKDRITLQPDLTRAKLAKIIEETRNILTNLYITCENDFNKGVKLLNKIVKYRFTELQKRRADMLRSAGHVAMAEDVARRWKMKASASAALTGPGV